MPNYPGTQNTDDNLYLAVNNLSTVLTADIGSSDTTIPASDTTDFPSVGILTIDLEAIHYTGKTATSFTGATRGFDGTTAAVHSNGVTIFHDLPAAHHNVLKEEIKAVTDDLRDAFTADLDDTASPATTAADLKARIDQLSTQLKNIISGSDWKDAPTNTINAIETELNDIESDLDDAVTPAASAADLGVRLDHIATQLKNITGETDWKTAPGTALNGKVSKAGDTMSGNLDMGSNQILSVADATTAQGAAAFGQVTVGDSTQDDTSAEAAITESAGTWTATGLSQNITPKNTSNSVMIFISANLRCVANAEETIASIRVKRDSTVIATWTNFADFENNSAQTDWVTTTGSAIWVDSPATTSPVTYTVEFQRAAGGSVIFDPAGTSAISTMVLFEIQ